MPVLKQLQANHFDTIIRQIKKAAIGKVEPIQTATHANLRRLKLGRDVSKAVEGIPDGSDQWDPMSLIAWMGKLTKVDKVPKDASSDTPEVIADNARRRIAAKDAAKAVAQLVAIDATCVARTTG